MTTKKRNNRKKRKAKEKVAQIRASKNAERQQKNIILPMAGEINQKNITEGNPVYAIAPIAASKMKDVLPKAQATAKGHAVVADSGKHSGMIFFEKATATFLPLTSTQVEHEIEFISPNPASIDSIAEQVEEATAGPESQVATETEKRYKYQMTGIYRIPVHGMITANIPYDHYPFGGYYVNPESILQEIYYANKSRYVETIVLDFNSPGGELYLGQEVVEAINSSDKPIISYISQYACSQAYLFASATDRIYSARDGIVGSLGIMTSFMTEEEMEGFTVSQFAQRKNSEESSISIGNELEELYHNTIAEGRDTTLENVRTNFGNGEEIIASRAEELGMIDEISPRHDFYLSLMAEINFDEEAAEERDMMEDVNVGDIDLDPDQIFEMAGRKVVEEEVPTIAQATVLKKAVATSKNTTPVETFTAKATQTVDEIESVDSSAGSDLKQVEDTTEGNLQNNTNMSDDIKHSDEVVDNQNDEISNLEQPKTPSQESAKAKTNKTSDMENETIEKTEATSDDLIQISAAEMQAMINQAVQANTDSITSAFELEKEKAALEAKKIKERRTAILDSSAGKAFPELAQQYAENDSLASLDADAVVALLDAAVAMMVVTAEEVEEVEKEAAEAVEAASAELSATETKIDALEKQLEAANAQAAQTQELLQSLAAEKQELAESVETVVSPMIAAMGEDENQPNIGASASADPLGGARGTFIEKDAQEKAAQAVADVNAEDEALLDVLTLFGEKVHGIDEAKANNLIDRVKRADKARGYGNHKDINPEVIGAMGIHGDSPFGRVR